MSTEMPTIEVDWMDGLPAPSAVLELLSCHCKSVCDSDCPCVINGLKCSEMCRLKECSNSTALEDLDENTQIFNSAGDIYSDEEDLSDSEDGFDLQPKRSTTFCPDPVEELEIETAFSCFGNIFFISYYFVGIYKL
jgi:hypothetical protein